MLFVVCFTTVVVHRCHTARNWLMINCKAVNRKRSWLNGGTIPTFSWRDSVKPPNPRTANDPSQIRRKLAALPLGQHTRPPYALTSQICEKPASDKTQVWGFVMLLNLLRQCHSDIICACYSQNYKWAQFWNCFYLMRHILQQTITLSNYLFTN
jgi:hypothetical protein